MWGAWERERTSFRPAFASALVLPLTPRRGKKLERFLHSLKGFLDTLPEGQVRVERGRVGVLGINPMLGVHLKFALKRAHHTTARGRGRGGRPGD